MLARLQNRIGGLPDLLLRDGLLVDGKRNRLPRDAYLKRLSFYADERLRRDRSFFAALPGEAPERAVVSERAFLGGEELLLRYPSAYEALNPAMRDAVAAYARNRDGYLFLWRHDARRPRPLVLCVHGFQMGEPRQAMNLFRVAKLFGAGLDVALFIQPHHWRRSDHPRNPFGQTFINPHDVPLTIEALGQAVCDLRSAYLLLEDLGYARIGLIGASLGGYVNALYAAAGPAPAFVFAAVPALRLDRTLAPRAHKLGFRIDGELRRTTREALRVAAPAEYMPRMSVGDIGVVYHAGDKIADVGYTREWVARWNIQNVTVLDGGHWAVFDGKARGRAWYAWLDRYGFTQTAADRRQV